MSCIYVHNNIDGLKAVLKEGLLSLPTAIFWIRKWADSGILLIQFSLFNVSSLTILWCKELFVWQFVFMMHDFIWIFVGNKVINKKIYKFIVFLSFEPANVLKHKYCGSFNALSSFGKVFLYSHYWQDKQLFYYYFIYVYFRHIHNTIYT